MTEEERKQKLAELLDMLTQPSSPNPIKVVGVNDEEYERYTDITVMDCEQESGYCSDDFKNIFKRDGSKDELDDYNFVKWFAKSNDYVCCNGVWYNPEGEVSKTRIIKEIGESIAGVRIVGRMAARIDSLYSLLKQLHSVDELPVTSKVIPLSNGDLHLKKQGWEFRLGEKKPAPYRLNVGYNPLKKPAPLFEKWLREAFEPDDIKTLQEIMGYCLVPSTSVGEAFIIVGDAEAGKSGFGTILMGLLGKAAMSMETQSLLTKQFQVADIENKLVAYDDDLGSAALTETNMFKKLVTADTPIRAERKFVNSYQFRPYARIVASANFMLTSLYDDSDGFYRRLHPIHIKPRDPKRVVMKGMYEKILQNEREQVLRWALDGLHRVIDNGWKISWSQRSIDYMKNSKSTTCHYEDFINETCEIVAGGSGVTTSELIYAYHTWCKDNGIKEMGDRRVTAWLGDNSEKLGIERSRTIKRGSKYLRGYMGIKIREEWQKTGITLVTK